ncbi:hypothetical protein PC129_g14713 [Phytophthora cactorum]|uniref:Uncharacterized protein n=1 Tax=Phytophthora cactorum TaxID=29920 RepID=A0A8T1FGG4_9STRA|nr:hypothetical protein Pcac1_g12185 [Phytophthora cactorum]KAG3084752.1 hypothetical protein PI125_g19430 [Phytophthora idaei]KAG2890544.1 hypothetical protein PC114_g17411 [Phytophthora cactorum]KAG2919293.1 hypothetical protein PC117_g16837 [Phytophthora cactorum]KAG2972329.1 hypothetical protein PC118_g15746 [Phytophthora cactorum]
MNIACCVLCRLREDVGDTELDDGQEQPRVGFFDVETQGRAEAVV